MEKSYKMQQILYNHPSISKFSDEVLYLILAFGLDRTVMFALLMTAEMFLFKIFYICNYSRIAGADEYFLTNFVSLFNIMIIFGFTVIRIGLEEHSRTRIYHRYYAEPHVAYRKVLLP